MTSPVYFTVEADFKAFIEDASTDSDYDPQVMPISATVTFTPLINSGDVVLATNASPRPTGFIPAPITAIIDPADGRLKMRTGTDAGATGFSFAPVRLLGSSALLELDGPLEYSVRFSEVVFSNGRRGTIAGFNFEAPNTDTVLNLIEVARVPGQVQSGITKIAPGGVRLEDGDIIFSFAGLDIPESIPFTPLFTSTEITDSTVTGRAVITAADAAAARTAIGAENAAMKGASGGYAPLDSSAKIDAAYLPSYVDDVLSYANQAAFPVTGETGKIYVAQDTGDAFRWTGSAYLRISDRVTATGITDSTVTGRALVTASDATAAKTTLALQNVTNTSDANKPISTATQAALDTKENLADKGQANGYTPLNSLAVVDPVFLPSHGASSTAVGRLVDRMTVAPSALRTEIIEALIDDLILSGVWDSLDGLYVFAAHDRQAARLNWTGGGNPVPPSVGYSTWKPASMRDCTEVNAPTFTTDRGFTGDGVAAYLDTNTRGVDLSKYAPTDCSAGVYVRTNFKGNIPDIAGVVGLAINPSNESNNTVVYANSGFLTAANGGDTTGLFGFSRSGTTATVYKDGAQIGSGTVSTLSQNPNQTIEFLRSNTDDFAFSPRQLAAGFVGKSLTAEQWADIDSAMAIYLTALGAAV